MDHQNQALFTQGFNNGYLLEQYEPALLATVLHNLCQTTAYVSGLCSGQREFRQQRIDLEYEQLSKLRDTAREQHRNIER